MPPRFELLRHIVGENGIHVDDAKILVIRHASSLSNRMELRSMISLASYNRCCIKRLANITSPLTEKTSDKVPFKWTENMQNAFE